MSAVAALIMLADAATACVPPGAARLRAGATIVQPVATGDPLPVQQLGPAVPMTREHKIQNTAAPSNPTPKGDVQPERCTVLPNA